jgi:hypothetical protein
LVVTGARVRISGVYDYLLGGRDSHAAERALAEQLLGVAPAARALARHNRLFVVRAIHDAVQAGIRQVIDVGTGLPSPPSVLDAALAADPGVGVVAVDIDPTVVAHHRALLPVQGDRLRVVPGDVRRPADLLDRLTESVDFSQTVAVMLAGMLHLIPDTPGREAREAGHDQCGDGGAQEAGPAEIVAAFTAAMPIGSRLVISHPTSTGVPRDLRTQITGIHEAAGWPVTFRPQHRIEQLFTGLDLIGPGVVDVHQWRPDPATPHDIPPQDASRDTHRSRLHPRYRRCGS